MLRFAVGVVASGAVLLASAASHVLATWALPMAAVSLIVGALIAVVAMEARDVDGPGDPVQPLRLVPPLQGSDGP